MTYLVDSNVLSELTKPFPNANVVAWLRNHQGELVVNPIVLGEIEYGILILPDGEHRRALEKWFQQHLPKLITLDFDKLCATEWARLLAKLKKNGTPMPIKDSLIAATALRHGLTVCTRNTSDFAKSGVPQVNPFES